MKRAEIETRIRKSIADNTAYKEFLVEEAIDELTDLFIALSNERCQEQRQICVNVLHNEIYPNWISLKVVNAPLPELE